MNANQLFATAVSSAEAIRKATVFVTLDQSRPSSTTYTLVGESAAVQCKINSLLREFPPKAFGTCVSTTETGAIVTRTKVRASTRESGDFDSHVQGIPCQVVIDSCTVVKGSHSYNAPSDLDYHGYTEIEFHLLDRKGYAAPWLEKKLSEQDRIRIEEEVLSHNSEE